MRTILTPTRTLRSLLALSVCAVFVTSSHGDEDRQMRVVLASDYKQECGNCHTAYSPSLLGAQSWRRLLSNLPQHFGTDASLDADTVRRLATWLTANAASGKRSGQPPQDRITQSTWFVREHREVPKDAWSRASIRSASNCAACHVQANEGLFNEHDVYIPR